MTRWVALLRGINVGGNNRVPMADLRDLCAALWLQSASKTYIASGNLIFSAAGSATQLSTELEQAIHDRFGLNVPVLCLAEAEFRAAVTRCPFSANEGKTVHAIFCLATAQIDSEKQDALTTAGEQLVQDGATFWLHTPQGFGTSKLAEKLWQVIGRVPTTARNLNTLRKLVEMLDAPV